MAKKVQGYVKLQVPAGSANPSPPIGPALGQQGVNIMEFCKQFNAATQKLEKGLPIPTVITVYADRSFTFIMKTPPAAVLIRKAIGIEKGMMTTIHSYTGDQPTLDTMHKDLYRGRAAALSMIPTSTGAAKAVGLVMPDLNGKLDGVSVRVPTPNVSLVDFKFIAKRATTAKEVNDLIRAAANGPLKGILGYTDEKLVSSDFNHNPHSSIFHMDQTKVMDGNMVSIMSWYDNEWGFSTRMSDTAVAWSKLI